MNLDDKKYDTAQKELVEKGIQRGNFDEEQIELIYSTLNNLNDFQINKFVNPNYNEHQMAEILWGMAWNFTIDQLSIFADEKFNSSQMMVIRYCIDDGFTNEQIEYIANPKHDFIEMMDIKEKFKIEIKYFETYSVPKIQ